MSKLVFFPAFFPLSQLTLILCLIFTDGQLYIDHYRASIFAFWYFAHVTFYFFSISVLQLHAGHDTAHDIAHGTLYVSCLE